MGFQFDEKMMAPNRAIITREKTENDLFNQDPIKNKPGMMHYIEDSCRLFMSIKPMSYTDLEGNTIVKNYAEVITELNTNTSDLGLGQYIKRVGGESCSLTGKLYSDVENESPFNIKSIILNKNLNADMVDGYHASIESNTNTICIRDINGNININNKLSFSNLYLESIDNSLYLKNYNNSLSSLYCSSIKMNKNNKESELIWNGTDWITNINNESYTVLTSKVMDELNVYGANIVMQSEIPTDVRNENTYWFELVGE